MSKPSQLIINLYDDRHPEVARASYNLGVVCYKSGNTKKALVYCQKAYEILGELYGQEHPRTKMIKDFIDSLKTNLY